VLLVVVVAVVLLGVEATLVLFPSCAKAVFIVVVAELVIAKGLPHASSIEVIMNTTELNLSGEDPFFLVNFLFPTDMYKRFFCSYHLRDWKLFSTTTLLKF
jgi:hypothetical protein